MDGYFEDGRCGCGYDSFIQIRGDRYYTETPLHGREAKASALHRQGDEWELVSPPPVTNSLFMVFTNELVVRVRMEEGDLYLSYAGRTNWARHARVYNPWRIWLPRLQARLMVHEQDSDVVLVETIVFECTHV